MGIEHTRLAADKGYDSKSNREHAFRHGMKPYIPERKRGKGEPKFEYDRLQDKLVCPAGKRSAAKTPNGNGEIFTFSVEDCRNCPYAFRCLRESQKARQVYWVIDPAKRKPKGMKLAMRIRKVVERVHGEAKVWHGMARARYRGLAKVTIQVLLTYMVINAKKMAAAAA